ncbi:MAG: transglycosylase SLT domain-containing protein [Paralcaligenes sp.]
MLLKRQQRYQKTRNFSGGPFGALSLRSWWLALSLGLAGCAGAKLPNNAVDTAASQAPVAQQALPAATKPVPLLVVSSPEAEQAVVDARAAMQSRQWDSLASLVPLAKGDSLLGDYPAYWYLRQQLADPTATVPTAMLQEFLSSSRDAYLVNRLKGDWIVAAARAGDYATVNNLGPVVGGNAQIECAQMQAQAATGRPVSAAQTMAVFAPGQSCWAFLGQQVLAGTVGWKQLDPLLRATLETSKTGDAQRLAGLMFSPSEMSAYRALMQNPRKWLTSQKAPTSQAQIELVTLALSRLARSSDRPAAAGYVESQWSRSVPSADLQWVWGQFGLASALNLEGQAVTWYRRSGDVPMTDTNHDWQVRSELRQGKIDWRQVGKAIDKMSQRQRAEPVWTYWYGRALAAQGDHTGAQARYTSIENNLDFYGQLANEELGRPISIPPFPAPLTAVELAGARSNVGLQRAIKLFRLGWRPEAVPEWNFNLRGMSDRQLLAAAELARQEHIFDRVVNTSLQTKKVIDFRQRFIAPFEGRVAEKARLIHLDPAWVYGLIRQESRFITDARSSVGASGLMQLMPATARWVARKIGMNDFTPSSVNDFDTNTILGTSYLNMVLQDLDGSQVLATAGYNAGPGRSVLWRSKLQGPVEGAIFAETIPFTETRLYVKHVMSNATYYATMFTGQPNSLKARLGVISPEPNTKINLP